MKHRHHKIPRHIGGTDDPDNIEILTIEKHAEAHRKLYEEHGRWQDQAAWLGLSARIGKEELERLVREIGYQEYLNDPDRVKDRAKRCSETLRERYEQMQFWATGLTKETDERIAKAADGVQRFYDNGGEPWNKGQTKATHPGCVKISEAVKLQAREGNFHCIGDYQRGRTFDEDHCSKLSEKAMQRTKKTCQHCGLIVSPAMFARWHGDNCKRRS